MRMATTWTATGWRSVWRLWTRSSPLGGLSLLILAGSALSARADAQSGSQAPSASTVSPRKAPKPGASFPNSESYYPPEAKRAGQEGAAVIHFCVDTNGKLTEPPVISRSSGNDALDKGALGLANAGSGYYLPGMEDGKPIPSCGQFKIQFELRDSSNPLTENPNIPTISARMIKLGSEYGRRTADLGKGFAQPAADGAHSVGELRQYARNVESSMDNSVALFADFLDDLDYLGQDPSIPDAERATFREIWPDARAGLASKFREVLGATRDVVRAMDEMADYISFSVQRRPTSDGAAKPLIPVDDPQFNAIRERAQGALRKLQGYLGSASKEAPAGAE
jgi:TonB family protein